MTAVEWLINQLEREYNSFPLLNFEECIIAKEMEKEQLQKAIEFSAEGMYSEEEVISLLNKRDTHTISNLTTHGGNWLIVEEWFNHFKNK